MKKQLSLVVLGLVVVLLAAGRLARAAAGPEPNDVQDSLPTWSSNGVDIAFERGAQNQLSRVLDMSAGGSSVHVVADGQLRGFVPGSEHLLVQVDEIHTVLLPDSGTVRQPLASYLGSAATASPDGRRIAYVRGGTLYVASIDGSAERAVATGVARPDGDVVGSAWSQDGTRVAIATGDDALLVAHADGSGARVIPGGTNPSWNPSSTLIAFERQVGTGWQIWTVHPDGSSAQPLVTSTNSRFPQFDPVFTGEDRLAFISDREHLIGGATQYQYALYTYSTGQGRSNKLLGDVHPYSPPAWNSAGTAIAVAAGQECRRWGIYVVSTRAADRHRRSNICRFDGTARADRTTGSPYFDLINGKAGDDVIDGRGGNDKIAGENGDDTIFGGAGNDYILGGPGNDRIDGGSGNDTIIGGNGRDVISCGLGDDTVEGAGPLDRIARNCEHVRR